MSRLELAADRLKTALEALESRAPGHGALAEHSDGLDRRVAELESERERLLMQVAAMRWNVVVGGQLFSKSFLGYTTYKMAFATREGLLPALIFLVAPLFILWALVKILPPWEHDSSHAGEIRHGSTTGV